MPIIGKIDVALKISQMPNEIKDSGSDKEFLLNADGIEISVKLHNKLFQRLQQTSEKYPSWVALIEGKMGNPTDKGFILDDAKIQVFEKKPKLVENNP